MVGASPCHPVPIRHRLGSRHTFLPICLGLLREAAGRPRREGRRDDGRRALERLRERLKTVENRQMSRVVTRRHGGIKNRSEAMRLRPAKTRWCPQRESNPCLSLESSKGVFGAEPDAIPSERLPTLRAAPLRPARPILAELARVVTPRRAAREGPPAGSARSSRRAPPRGRSATRVSSRFCSPPCWTAQGARWA